MKTSCRQQDSWRHPGSLFRKLSIPKTERRRRSAFGYRYRSMCGTYDTLALLTLLSVHSRFFGLVRRRKNLENPVIATELKEKWKKGKPKGKKFLKIQDQVKHESKAIFIGKWRSMFKMAFQHDI